MTREEFIKKSKKIYGNKYDYKSIREKSLENYNTVPIICDKHGLFFQSVYDHLEGKGCFKCYCENEKLTDKT